jgi:hypothetical protein
MIRACRLYLRDGPTYVFAVEVAKSNASVGGM